MMKVCQYIFFSLSLLFLELVWSLPVPSPMQMGTYLPGVQAREQLQSVEHRVIFTSTAKGREELKRLRSEGYSCRALPREFQDCSKSVSFFDSAWIESRLQSELGSCRLEVGENEGAPDLINAGEFLTEWGFAQPVSFCGEVFKAYRMLMSPQIHKIFLGSPAKHTLNLNGDNQPWLPISLQQEVSRFHFYRYFVQVPMQRAK